MSKAIHDKKRQWDYLQQRIVLLQEMMQTIDPKQATESEMDRFLEMLEAIQFKAKQYRNDWLDS